MMSGSTAQRVFQRQTIHKTWQVILGIYVLQACKQRDSAMYTMICTLPAAEQPDRHMNIPQQPRLWNTHISQAGCRCTSTIEAIAAYCTAVSWIQYSFSACMLWVNIEAPYPLIVCRTVEVVRPERLYKTESEVLNKNLQLEQLTGWMVQTGMPPIYNEKTWMLLESRSVESASLLRPFSRPKASKTEHPLIMWLEWLGFKKTSELEMWHPQWKRLTISVSVCRVGLQQRRIHRFVGLQGCRDRLDPGNCLLNVAGWLQDQLPDWLIDWWPDASARFMPFVVHWETLHERSLYTVYFEHNFSTPTPEDVDVWTFPFILCFSQRVENLWLMP